MLGEQSHVADPRPQRRQLDATDGETEEQVVAETPHLHLAIEIPTGRGDHPHVDAHPLARADALNLAALQRPQ